jgi:hypothetical protein
MGGGVDKGSNVDFQGFGVLVGFAMTQPALDEVGVPNLIEKSPGSMEMKWRGSWPVDLLCTVVVTFGRVTSHPSKCSLPSQPPAFSTATKNYKYLGLVPPFLLPFFQNYPLQFLTSIRRLHGLQRPWKQARSRIRLWRKSRRTRTKKTRFQHYCL